MANIKNQTCLSWLGFSNPDVSVSRYRTHAGYRLLLPIKHKNVLIKVIKTEVVTKKFTTIFVHIFCQIGRVLFQQPDIFLFKNACFKSIFIRNHFLIVSYSIINRFNHQIIENINIQETAKIKILQIITKSSTAFTNMMLDS